MKAFVKACIDTNVWISGFVFTGVPAKVVDLALKKYFEVISSSIILNELTDNLIHKFHVDKKAV